MRRVYWYGPKICRNFFAWMFWAWNFKAMPESKTRTIGFRVFGLEFEWEVAL